MNFNPNTWDVFQQPAHPAPGLEPRRLALLAALDLGWNVSDPVYLRPRWAEDGPWVYHLILHKDGRIQMVTLPAGPDMDWLIGREGWRVDRYPR